MEAGGLLGGTFSEKELQSNHTKRRPASIATREITSNAV
jgi:hypothetical protein